jgi:hypothetical protein
MSLPSFPEEANKNLNEHNQAKTAILEKQMQALHREHIMVRPGGIEEYFETYESDCQGMRLLVPCREHYSAVNSDESSESESNSDESSESESNSEEEDDVEDEEADDEDYNLFEVQILRMSKDYELRQCLHRTKHVIVYAATTRWSGVAVALKIHLRPAFLKDHCDPKEVRILTRLQGSPQTAVLVAWHRLREHSSYVVATKLIGKLALSATVLAPPTALPVGKAIPRYVRSILQALVFMHARGVLCRDVKPSNFLWDGTLAIAIDFDVSTFLDGCMHTRAVGTDGYMAPEVTSRGLGYGIPADIFSAGVVLGQLLAGVAEQDVSSDPEAASSAQGFVRTAKCYDQALGCDPCSARHLLLRMLSLNPSRRITLDEALSHPFLAFDEHI